MIFKTLDLALYSLFFSVENIAFVSRCELFLHMLKSMPTFLSVNIYIVRHGGYTPLIFVCKVIVAALDRLITYLGQIKFTFPDNCYVVKLLSDAAR